MDISRLTPQQMKEILLKAYQIGRASETMEAKDLIEVIKLHIITALGGN